MNILDKREQRSALAHETVHIAQAIFADNGCGTIILGAYGCGVFRNDPADVTGQWEELLCEYGGYFDKVLFAVLEYFKTRDTITDFERKWGVAR